MILKKAKSNRKPIVINRNQLSPSANIIKEQVLHQFDSVFQTNVQTYIQIERKNLKSLDKRIAKRVVGAAQNNLLHFLKSRAKIYCLRSQQNVHPFHLGNQEKSIAKHSIFDNNKLQLEIEKQQKFSNKRVKPVDYSPLIERCMRQTAKFLENRASQVVYKKQTPKKEVNYIPLSAHHRKRRFLF